LDDLTWKEGGYAGRPEGPALDYFKPGTEVRSLIPYRRDKSANLVWAKDRSAAEVQTYISGAAESFQIPEADEEAINNLWWSKRLEHAGEYFLGMLASAAALYVVSWIVGWVVRGFLGIPRGSDTRA
jgi:hypothetical protein